MNEHPSYASVGEIVSFHLGQEPLAGTFLVWFRCQKSHGQRSMVSYSPLGRKESDTTEQLYFHKCVLLNSDMEKELERIHIYQE